MRYIEILEDDTSHDQYPSNEIKNEILKVLKSFAKDPQTTSFKAGGSHSGTKHTPSSTHDYVLNTKARGVDSALDMLVDQFAPNESRRWRSAGSAQIVSAEGDSHWLGARHGTAFSVYTYDIKPGKTDTAENVMVPDGTTAPVIEDDTDVNKDWNGAIENALGHFSNMLERKVNQLNMVDPQQSMDQSDAIQEIINCINYAVPLDDQEVLLDFSHPVGQRFLRGCRRIAISLHLDLKLMDHALDQATAS